MFFTEEVINPICIKWAPGDPSTIFLATTFIQKMPEGSDSMYSSILMLETYDFIILTEVDRIHMKIVNLFQFSSGPRGPIIGKKTRNFL